MGAWITLGRMIRWTLLFVVLIIFGSGAVAFYTVFFRPEGQVVVPLFRERTITDAVEEAQRLGIVVKKEDVASSLSEGRVLAQNPEAGTRIRKGQVVVLQVSRGGELHAVPDVRGQNLPRAQAVIREQGFMLGDVVRIQDASQPGGAVIAQSPASPANISVSRKIDLLVNEGGASGEVMVPDVNRMTEQEARNLIEASGLTIQIVDRVYSPLMPEGLAIETRPGAGTTVKAGSGVRLKIASLNRPAGDTTTPEPRKDVRRVTPQQSQQPTTPTPTPTERGGRVVVNVPGQGEIFIGDGTTPADTPITEADPNVPVIEQTRRPVTPTPARPQTPQTPAQPPAQTPAQPSGSGSKTARIRYQVPPLTSPMNLRIELTDPSGKRDVLNRQARSGESVSVTAPYTRECVVTVYLGGEFVWQEKYR